MSWARGLVTGIAAGAAGTTALNTITYLDMTARGCPTSTTPEATVEKLSDTTHVPVPGNSNDRPHRVEGLAALTGILAGVTTGAALGAARSIGWKPSLPVAAAAAALGAFVGANAPMTALGVADPRTWAAQDWLTDIAPHAAFGIVTAWTLQTTDTHTGT